MTLTFPLPRPRRERYAPRHASARAARLRRGAAAARRNSRRTGRAGSRPIVSALLVVLGAGVMLYPVVATQYNNIKQRDFAQAYRAQVEAAPREQLDAALSAAEAYNTKLTGVPILDPHLSKAVRPPESHSYREYTGLLAGHGVMARLRVPSAGVDLPIYHGTTDEVLAKGVGHLYGTALPVGGTGRHAVLTSHTGLANATLLDHLVDVRLGDRFVIEVSGRTLAYEVDQIQGRAAHRDR